MFKKILSALLALMLIISVAGCGESEPVDEFQEQEDRISSLIFEHTPSATNINITTDEDGLYNLSISYTYGKVAYFGNYVLAIQSAFEEVFDVSSRGHFSVDLVIDGKNPSMIRYRSDDGFDDGNVSGMITDSRSGELVFTNIDSLDDLIEEFPAVSIFIDETGIFSDSIDTDTGLDEYPKNSTSKYLATAEAVLPEEIYTTLASENGLSGTVYYVEGEVIEKRPSGDVDVRIIKLQNEHLIGIMDFVGYAAGLDEIFLNYEPGADYTMPEVGVQGNFYITYSGYSSDFEMPLFYLGAHEIAVETLLSDE